MKPIRFIISSFIAWRLLLVGIALAAVIFVPARQLPFLGGGIETYSTNPLFWGWANFDGNHYLSVALNGYTEGKYSSFPLYPLLARYSSSPFGLSLENLLITGLLISNLAFFAASFVFWKLVRLDYSEKVAKFSLLALGFFPASFYFASFYAEPLFLLLALLTFYLARKRKWVWAGLAGAAASVTRVQGILLLLALFVEHLTLNKKRFDWKVWLGLSLVALGLLSYIYFQWSTTGDSLAFIREHYLLGEHRQAGFVLLPQVFWRYLNMILTVNRADPIYFTIAMEAAVAVGGLLLLVLGYLVRLRASYLVFAALAYLVPTVSGSFSSMPRFLIVIFPLFIILGIFLSERNRVSRVVYFGVSVFLLAVATALFFRGYWVA